MIPLRDLGCDNDDCDWDDQGVWMHVEGCEAPDTPPVDAAELQRNARPGSFLATMMQGPEWR